VIIALSPEACASKSVNSLRIHLSGGCLSYVLQVGRLSEHTGSIPELIQVWNHSLGCRPQV